MSLRTLARRPYSARHYLLAGAAVVAVASTVAASSGVTASASAQGPAGGARAMGSLVHGQPGRRGHTERV